MLLGLVWIWGWFTQKRVGMIKYAIKYWVVVILLAIPAIYLAVFANGQSRFSAINIFQDPTTINRVIRDRNFFSNPGSLLAKVTEKQIYL